jgi:hypothetical protein
VYAIAEVLHKFVWQVEQIPIAEYLGWIAYFEEKDRKQEVKKGNIMAMKPDEIASQFRGR